MPIYAFESKDGKQRELSFPMSKAPSIGTEILIDGKPFRRIPSFTLADAQIARRTHKYPYVSHRLPGNLEGAESVRVKRRDGSYGREKPLIRSREHEREIASRWDLTPE